ncbi:MAG: KEOPS complex subunit Cgi121 [Candidatus Diapherotrites archaeon]
MFKKFDIKFFLIFAGLANIEDSGTTIKKLLVGAKNRKTFIQLISLKPIASEQQIIFALEQSMDSFAKKTNFSKSLELEFLTRLSGQRQIGKAMDLFGLGEGKNEVALILYSENKKNSEKLFDWVKKEIDFREKKNLISANAKKNRKFIAEIYGIGKEEMKILPLRESVLERIAMVALS